MANAADLVVSLLEEATATLTDPPERRYVSHGEPAADCEQLTAHIVALRPKLLDQRGGDLAIVTCAMSWMATLAVVLFRCVPIPDPGDASPDASALDEAYQDLAADGEAIARGLTRQWALGAWPPNVACTDVQWQPLAPIAPSGGLAGWRLVVEVQL